MWIKRSKYEGLLRDSSLTSHLRTEVDYWRGKFEEEKERADRIGDRVFEIEGRAPVSTSGMKEARITAKEIEEEAKKKLVEMMGQYEEDDGKLFIHDEYITFETVKDAEALGVK